jgi:hypothetical protein
MAVHTLSRPVPRRHPLRRIIAAALMAVARWIDPPRITVIHTGRR